MLGCGQKGALSLTPSSCRLLFITNLLCCPLEHALVSSGTCQSNNHYDVAQVDCETAATSLGLSDTSVSEENDIGFPPGCYYYRNGQLYFNNAQSSPVSCGTAGDDCICGALGTGTALPQPTQRMRVPSLLFFLCCFRC